jgi:mRNA interferase RelE/StbE
MIYRVELAPEAQRQFHAVSAYHRAKIRRAIDRHLAINPTCESKSRIKRLRELKRPQYRIRVDDYRVFYDVCEHKVSILGIVAKTDANRWLEKEGAPS